MGAYEIFLGLSGETPERPVKLLQPSCQEAEEGRGATGPTRGTLLHTGRSHRSTNSWLFALRLRRRSRYTTKRTELRTCAA